MCAMSKCPYTWFKSIFSSGTPNSSGEATYLRVAVVKNAETVVDVSLPARSARWLIELIPEDVITTIKNEGIPIDDIQDDLSKRKELKPQKIFKLVETHREVEVWLE
jgi:hypothetical protein